LTELLAHFEDGEKKSFLDAFRIHNIKTRYCIFSLSKSPSILSQWRAYAEDSTGVAIGLNRQFLEGNVGAKLVACEYKNHEEITKDLKDKHEAFIKSVHLKTRRGENNGMNSIVEWIEKNKHKFTEVIENTMSLKNEAFIDEQEVRAILVIDSDKMEMRVSGDLMIPYTEKFLWGEDNISKFRGETIKIEQVIHEIWLGPKCNELNKIALRMKNISYCDIEKYDCGYI
jgi:hypothetical protein